MWTKNLINIQSSVGAVYVIELTRWGITQGIPAKPYKTADYYMGDANMNGFNNALSWAYSNNYNYVILPRGSYALCYNNKSIQTQPNMTIDFNGSTLKVIYDSVNRSPFDTSTNPVYSWGGTTINCVTPNTHIVNLNLIGDRIDRSWIDPNERNMEVSKGINFGAGAHNSSVKYSSLGWYMADSVVLGFSPYNILGNQGYATGVEFGSIDDNTGLPITGITSNSVRYSSNYQIPLGTKSFTMIGLGYAPQTNIPTKQYNAYFYKSDGTFLCAKKSIRTRDMVWVPMNATQMKLSWEGDGSIMGGAPVSPYWHLLISDGIADNLQVEFCEIHHCHRGGMFLGTNNAVIRKNYFHDTGHFGDSVDYDGIPTFNSPTRYGIDTEDNVGHNCRIIDNIFENIRIAITVRGEYIEISGNEIRNCLIGVSLYRQNHAVVTKNYFYNTTLSNFEFTGFDRDWIIAENIFYDSDLNLTGTGSVTSVVNNRFHSNSTCSIYFKVFSFKDNTFDNSQYSVVGDRMTLIDNCTFMNRSSIVCVGQSGLIYDRIERCTFMSGSFIRGQTLQQIIVRDSEFRDGYFQFNTNAFVYTYINCVINNPTQPLITSSGNIGVVNYTLELQNCTVNLGLSAPTWTPNTQYNVTIPLAGTLPSIVTPTTYNGYYYTASSTIPDGGYYGNSGNSEPSWSIATVTGATIADNGITWVANPLPKIPLVWGFNWGKIIITNSTVNWNVYSSYNKGFLDNFGSITDSIQITNSTISASPALVSNAVDQCAEIKIDSTSIFKNVSLTSPAVEIQSDKMSSSPTVGLFKLGQQIENANPTSGGYLGWVCTTGGYASNVAWVSGTNYLVNAIVNTSGNVYKCTGVGASTSTSKPTGTVSATYADGYTWQYLGIKAVFNQFGLIS